MSRHCFCVISNFPIAKPFTETFLDGCSFSGGFLDENQALVNYPFLLFDGRIENLSIEEDETNSVVSISIASHWADFDKTKGRKTNTNSQALHFPTDLGFDYASQTAKDIKWGKA